MFLREPRGGPKARTQLLLIRISRQFCAIRPQELGQKETASFEAVCFQHPVKVKYIISLPKAEIKKILQWGATPRHALSHSETPSSKRIRRRWPIQARFWLEWEYPSPLPCHSDRSRLPRER